MNRLLTIAFLLCLLCCLPTFAVAQENKPKPLKLLILDHPTSTGQPDVLAQVLAQSPNIQRVDAKSFWANITTISASTFKSEASIKKAQPQLAKALRQQGVETIFVWRSSAKGSTIWVIGPVGKWRGQVGKVWSNGRASQGEVQALLKQGFGLSAPVVLAWRKQQKNNPPQTQKKDPTTTSTQPPAQPKTPKQAPKEDPVDPKKETSTKETSTKPAQATKTTPSKQDPKDKQNQEAANLQKKLRPRPAKKPATTLHLHAAMSIRSADETTLPSSNVGQTVPQQTLTGISAGLAAGIFLSPSLAIQPSLNFDYHSTEVTSPDGGFTVPMNMTDVELLMSVLLVSADARHQLSVGLGAILSRWSFLELYPNILTDMFTASMVGDLSYHYWVIPSFFVMRASITGGSPLTGEYGPTSRRLNSGFLLHNEFGASLRLLNWLWLNFDANTHYQSQSFDIFPPSDPSNTIMIQSDWFNVDLKLGVTTVW